MIFNFPPHPDQSNWLQDFLIILVKEAIKSRFANIKPKNWKSIILSQKINSNILSRRYGLKSRYEELVKEAQKLTSHQATNFLAKISSPTFYKDVLLGRVSYFNTAEISEEFHECLLSLFKFGFELLGELENFPADGLSIRDSLYARAYRAMPGHFCPFCGIDRFDAPHPKMPRHALDHYLAISLYPIFGAHISNLVPMCGRCNSSFKLATDMLKSEEGAIRLCTDPYGDQKVTISLKRSIPFGNKLNNQKPDWVIDFVPDTKEFETWDKVFSIKFRYTESVLDAEYDAWLDEFTSWAIEGRVVINNSEDVNIALKRWASICPELNNQGFIKKPMFEMLADVAIKNDKFGNRITNLIITLCNM